MRQFQKILVANRGEIAIRVMRAATELGKRTVAVYAEEDKLSLHRFKADEAYLIGQGLSPVGAYLSIPEIIRVARACGADAIHPGYGMLSENPEFAEACFQAGIVFIGPSAETMRLLGDKASARRAAEAAKVAVAPATGVLPDDMDEVRRMAAEIGYPLMLKASWGGGGRGMRPIFNEAELEKQVLSGRREAEAAFGNGEGYLEKLILRARHVEVQILGDSHGTIVHLYERDCSIQRRNQKVVERAPAPYLTAAQRAEVCDMALRIARYAGYVNAGTVEFLMDADTDAFYFIEVNPRIQVEHTVTEEVTGVDIVKAQIRIAAGGHIGVLEETGVPIQENIRLNGHAMQSRITTEDPMNNFIPDYGRITAYRGAMGFGVRLDGGTAYAGAVITRHYDSLLEKVTVWAPSPGEAIRRMDRALREFRIRGVATNLAYVQNLINHPDFIAANYTTKFIEEHPELFQFTARQDRATKLLTYIADIAVNGHPEVAGRPKPPATARKPVAPKAPEGVAPPPGFKQILDAEGPKAVADRMLAEKRLLLTDTTMRDGHQSLLATRMRTYDIVRAVPAYAHRASGLFSLECWGGATFDVSMRFLQEDPWERLHEIRAAAPNLLLQMLLRASNGVGYTNYPDNVVRRFTLQAAESGVDVFRVFDSLNWVENMRVAMDAVLEAGKICEAAICYTGDILDPSRAKYDLAYYRRMAKDLAAAGAHVVGLKDMAGLLRPAAAKILVKAIKEETGLPVHFHTHDTSGISAASVLAAAEAGVDAVDAAMDSFSGLTSQPCLGSIAAALEHTERATGLDPAFIREMSDYWEAVRAQYAAFESNLLGPASEVYLHEMPGGQFTNLKEQARSLGLADRWHEVAAAYAEVNQMFGDVVKVTPSSKVVGDMALMMVAGGLSRADVENPEKEISFPESVVDFFRGGVGRPEGGFPEALQRKILKGEAPLADRPGALMPPADLEALRKKAAEAIGVETIGEEELCSYLMYPKVFVDYAKRAQEYGPVSALPTPNFFYGMKPGDEIGVELERGKTLVVSCVAEGESDDEGFRRIFFELNGQPRTARAPDRHAQKSVVRRPKATEGDPRHVAAPMPGVIASVAVQPGQKVRAGDALLSIEAMKMQTSLHAEREGVVKAVHAAPGAAVEAKDLLVEFEA
ncbi:pyruvate carboxylase [Neomegalonema perideroedes]|uniref:pyruvate carboxylase n=1 Tax=Neomegalonema perideroedes TaxID=217219 RepID=UPI00037EACC9|nr:pyruvate carboxylase [Neomegalonema perideroedes]